MGKDEFKSFFVDIFMLEYNARLPPVNNFISLFYTCNYHLNLYFQSHKIYYYAYSQYLKMLNSMISNNNYTTIDQFRYLCIDLYDYF